MKVLLYSGGMDSWLIDKIWKPDIKLYININGVYSNDEINRLPKDVKVVNFPLLGQFEDKITKYVPLRNLYFLMIASHYGDELCLGATAGDYGSTDKRPEFLDKAEEMLNYLLQKQSTLDGKKITIEKRFCHMSKMEIINEYLANGGSVEECYNNTFSCYNPNPDGTPCLNCKPCFRRFVTFTLCGHKYSIDEKKKMYDYFIKNEKNRKSGGTYYADRKVEGKDCVAVAEMLEKEFGNDDE